MKPLPAVLGLIAILALGYVSTRWFRNRLVSMTASNPSRCIEVLGSTTSEVDGRTYIVGSIKNNCQRSFGHVTIFFKLERTTGPIDGLPAGVAYASDRDVKPGETRDFKSTLPISKDSLFRVDGINAF